MSRKRDREPGECSPDDEPEVKKSNETFMLDLTGHEGTREKSASPIPLTASSSTPKGTWAASVFAGLLSDTPAKSTPKLPKKPVRSKASCFNCGGEHSVRECKEKLDHRKIKQASWALKQAKNGMNHRYHKEDDKNQMDYQPGKISANLRTALGIGPDDIPDWVYRMRRMGFRKGYPPGYLKRAVKSQDAGGTLVFHMSDGNTKNHEDKEEEKPSLDRTKVHFYFGFNKYYSALRERERHFRTPPFDAFCDILETELLDEWKIRSDKERHRKKWEERKEKKEKAQLKREQPDTEMEMDVDDLEQVDETETPSPSPKPKVEEDGGESISVEFGTPVLRRRRADGTLEQRTEMPDLSAFAVGIVPFSPGVETAEGRGIFKRIQKKLSTLVKK